MEVKEWNKVVAGYLRTYGLSVDNLRLLRANILQSQQFEAKMLCREAVPGFMSREVFETFFADAEERRKMVSALDDYIEYFEHMGDEPAQSPSA